MKVTIIKLFVLFLFFLKTPRVAFILYEPHSIMAVKMIYCKLPFLDPHNFLFCYVECFKDKTHVAITA